MIAVIDGLPYYCSEGKLYECEIDMTSCHVDFSKAVSPKGDEKGVYTLSEARKFLIVDGKKISSKTKKTKK